MLEQFCIWLVALIHDIGYPGLFLAMFLGNVGVPIPVEFTMIPAGYLVSQGHMGIASALGAAAAGDVAGSLCSYYISAHFGRRFLYKYGKYFLLNEKRIRKLEQFFASHGEISVLTGRLVPGLRHFMAFPAGLAHMHVKKFTLYTGVGGGLWLAILLGIGYIIGGEQALVKHYMPLVTTGVVAGVAVMIALYTCNHRKKARK